ncbi:hypothetical protein GC197_07020 [bacterium]|nr:hypothetical protein [bacterium]
MSIHESSYLRMAEAASQLVEPNESWSDGDVPLATLRHYVFTNLSHLETARACLGLDCHVPLEYEVDFIEKNLPNFQHLRILARVFRVEGSLYAREEQYEKVASVGIDLLELANATGRGGLKVDYLVGIGFSNAGIDLLRSSRTHYDQTTRDRLIRALPIVESQRETLDTVTERDHQWEIAVDYPKDSDEDWDIELPAETPEEEEEAKQLIAYLKELAVPEVKQSFEEESEYRALAMMRLLTIDLAIRSYHEQIGSFPQNLQQLASGILNEIPLDPFTGEDFIYRVRYQDILWQAPIDFLLYSPGPMKIDHGGSFGVPAMVALGEADLGLDYFDYFPKE